MLEVRSENSLPQELTEAHVEPQRPLIVGLSITSGTTLEDTGHLLFGQLLPEGAVIPARMHL
jgi:hypothetical protein